MVTFSNFESEPAVWYSGWEHATWLDSFPIRVIQKTWKMPFVAYALCSLVLRFNATKRFASGGATRLAT